MKRLALVFIVFLLSTALASAEETYGNSTYGNFSYGIASSASSSFTNNSVNIQNNTPTLINATDTNVTLELVTDATTNGSVTIVKYESKPSAVGTNTFTALNRYIDIVIDDSISAQLNYSVIKMFYTDAEVAAAGLDESTLRLSKWNGSQWISFDGAGIGGVETVDNYVWANTSSFSTWGIFGVAPAQAANNGGGGGGGGTAAVPFVPVAVEETPSRPVPQRGALEPEPQVAEPASEVSEQLSTVVSQDQTQQGGLAAVTGQVVQAVLGGGKKTGFGALAVVAIIVACVVFYKRMRKRIGK